MQPGPTVGAAGCSSNAAAPGGLACVAFVRRERVSLAGFVDAVGAAGLRLVDEFGLPTEKPIYLRSTIDEAGDAREVSFYLMRLRRT